MRVEAEVEKEEKVVAAAAKEERLMIKLDNLKHKHTNVQVHRPWLNTKTLTETRWRRKIYYLVNPLRLHQSKKKYHNRTKPLDRTNIACP